MLRHNHELLTEKKTDEFAEVEKAKAAELLQRAAQSEAERKSLIENYEATLSEMKR
jgi:hypothetical protein